MARQDATPLNSHPTTIAKVRAFVDKARSVLRLMWTVMNSSLAGSFD
jgi:hypothetical protein